MSEATLSQNATTLLKQLRAMPSVDAFDREAADELVAQGLAMHIPATGAIAATEAGRTAGIAAEAPADGKPLAADIVSGLGLEPKDARLAQPQDAGIPAMGQGIGVNGTAGSEGVSKSLKAGYAAAHH